MCDIIQESTVTVVGSARFRVAPLLAHSLSISGPMYLDTNETRLFEDVKFNSYLPHIT